MTENKQNRVARDGDGDGFVEDGTEFERPVAEASVVPEKAKKKTAEKVEEVPTQLTQDLVVSCEKLVFESLFERNSRSVGLTQIRLIELGYMSAGSDRRGWLSNGTKEALEAFMADKSLTGRYLDPAVIRAVFAKTPVTVV